MSLHEKLLKVQNSISVPKSHKNDFAKYKYRKCEDILEAAKPFLKQEGLVLTLTDDIVQVGDRFYVKATATVSDGNTAPAGIAGIQVSAFAREALERRGMDDSQITGSASSYARKYALNGLFCIDDTDDADATNEHDKSEPKAKPIPKPVPKAATQEQLTKIDALCAETHTNLTQLKELYKVKDLPDFEQAKAMIASLQQKHSKMLATPAL
jgi:hypothetical protein